MSLHEHAHHDHSGGPDMERYKTRDLIVTEDIMVKAKELAEAISNSAEVEFYKRAELQIQNHTEVQQLISTMKKRQKEAVAFETFQNTKMIKKIEGEIEELQNQLDEIPIVQEFQQSQSDINYLLQLVVSIVRETVSEKIELADHTEEAEDENCSD